MGFDSARPEEPTVALAKAGCHEGFEWINALTCLYPLISFVTATMSLPQDERDEISLHITSA